jgi:ankyrin repeat protein
VEVARLLLDAGADIEAETSWGAAPLAWAAVMGSVRVADLLLSRGAGGFTFVAAAALGKLEEVKAIVESGGDLSAQRRHGASGLPDHEWPADSALLQGDVLSDAMYSAARNGHTPVVAYLLDRGARIDAKGFFGATGLHWAAINGHRNTVDLLLSRGASLTIRDARFKVQELKRVCYEGGNVPGARCNPRNVASRKTLQKAGFVPCGHILNGSVAHDPGRR